MFHPALNFTCRFPVPNVEEQDSVKGLFGGDSPNLPYSQTESLGFPLRTLYHGWSTYPPLNEPPPQK